MQKIKAWIDGLKTKKFYILYVGILELIVLGALALVLYNKELDVMNLSGCMKSDYIVRNEDGTWYVDNVMLPDSVDRLLYTEPIYIEKGTYRIRMKYSTDVDTSDLKVFSESNNQLLLTVDHSQAIKAASNEMDIYLGVEGDVDDLQIAVQYDPWGYFRMDSIEIYETHVASNRMFSSIVFLVLIFNIMYVLRKYKTVIATLFLITFLAVIPNMIPGLIYGHDLWFHLNRIEGMAYGIQQGIFPIRIHPDALNSYGYPFSIYYGNLLLYVPAFLRIIGFSMTFAYEFYVVMITFVTGLLSYICLKHMFKKDDIALIGTLVYVLSPYRLVDIYARAALGEYTAFMYLPVVALAIYKIYTDDISDCKQYAKNVVILALGMTGLIQCHVLSTEIVAVFIALVCVLLLRKTLRLRTLLVYMEAVCLTVFINLFFLVPLLDYYNNVDVKINNLEEMSIQHKGAYVGQYFMFFENVYGNIHELISERLAFTPGIILMLVLLVWIMLLVKGKKDSSSEVFGVLSIIALWMSSNLFPWNELENCSIVGEFLLQVQFPWRYLTIAVICLTLLICRLFQKYEKEMCDSNTRKLLYVGIAALAILMACYVSGNIAENDKVAEAEGEYYNPYDRTDIRTNWIGVYDYVREGADIHATDGQVHTENVLALNNMQKDGLALSFYCETGELSGYADVPFFHYKGYKAYTEDGIELPISDGENKVVRVLVPAEYKGYICVRFEEPWYWKVANVVSLITVVMLSISIFISKIGQYKKKSTKLMI